ncbi:uncharacterized protein LOC121731498 [Aricia agestis]|uniref:uncharacterized protein LOC121731498 n=1 Tax=Aricia agestis TaxID=91739 RepID=UPI001C205471|nr:uncharacterized protein LOC121731498 [Aricia agestis]
MDPNIISIRKKSPTRAEAISQALRPAPIYSNGVLVGNWVEDRIECPKDGSLDYPPNEKIDLKKLQRESRQSDFRNNKLNSWQGNIIPAIKDDLYESCGNFATTTDLVYNHLPKPLCGPPQRFYKRFKNHYYPQQDLSECYGNITEWGLKEYLEYSWACDNVNDYLSTLYEDSFVPPTPQQYLQPHERKGRDGSFTKTFRFKMTKSKR